MPKAKWRPEDHDYDIVRNFGGVLKQDQLAQYYGVSVKTLQNRFKDNPDWRDAYDQGRADTIRRVGNALVKKALDGNLTAMIFYLKTQAGWWDKQMVEHSGPGGGAIEIETADQARRDVLGRLAQFASRLEAGTGAEGDSGGGRGELASPEARVELLGPPGPDAAEGTEVVPLADVVGTRSGEDSDGG